MKNILVYYIISAPPPGPTTSSSVGASGATGSSVVAPGSLGLVSTQQTHTPPQPPELPSKFLKTISYTIKKYIWHWHDSIHIL